MSFFYNEDTAMLKISRHNRHKKNRVNTTREKGNTKAYTNGLHAC